MWGVEPPREPTPRTQVVLSSPWTLLAYSHGHRATARGLGTPGRMAPGCPRSPEGFKGGGVRPAAGSRATPTRARDPARSYPGNVGALGRTGPSGLGEGPCAIPSAGEGAPGRLGCRGSRRPIHREVWIRSPGGSPGRERRGNRFAGDLAAVPGRPRVGSCVFFKGRSRSALQSVRNSNFASFPDLPRDPERMEKRVIHFTGRWLSATLGAYLGRVAGFSVCFRENAHV